MWEISNKDQATTFLYSIVFGIIICLFYDIIRAVRKSGANSYLAVFIGDVFFFSISSVLTFLFLLSKTNGEIRGYVLAGSAVGFIVCRFSISRIIFPLFVFIFVTIRKAVTFFNTSVNRFCMKMWGTLTKCALKIKKTLKNIKYSAKNS